MAEQAVADPVADLLRMSPLTQTQRKLAWDAFDETQDADALAVRIKDLALPQAVKAKLWDLKEQQAPPDFTTTNQTDASGHATAIDWNPLSSGNLQTAYDRSGVSSLVEVGKGALKKLADSGVRGGAILRKIPGVDAAANAVGSVQVPTEPTNNLQRLGGLVEQAAEIYNPTRAIAGLGTKTAIKAAPYLTRVLSPMLAKLVPQVAVEAAGNASLVKAQGGSNTAAGVTAGLSVLPPTMGIIATALAKKLRASATTSVEAFFHPTTKLNKGIVAKRTADILDRGSEVLGAAGSSREGAVETFASQRAAAGEAIDQALSTFGSDTVRDAPQRLMAALDAAKAPYVKTRIVSAAEAAGPMKAYVVGALGDGRVQVAIPLNGAKVRQIDGLKGIVAAHGDQMSVDDLVGLRRAWDEVAYANGPTLKVSAKWAKKMGGDAIRAIVASDTPELAALNREFSFWKDLEKVMSDTALRKTGQVGGLIPTMKEGAGAVAGAVVTGSAATGLAVGKVARLANAVFTSPRYASLAANVKAGLATAISTGNDGQMMTWLRIAASRVGVVEAPKTLAELTR